MTESLQLCFLPAHRATRVCCASYHMCTDLLCHPAASAGRLGLRKPLGADFHRRRYWALGGSAGSWRVYVEEIEGRLWGYYEGAQLLALANWLVAGGIDRELPLLHALAALPWPVKPELVLAMEEEEKQQLAEEEEAAAAAVAGAEAGEGSGDGGGSVLQVGSPVKSSGGGVLGSAGIPHPSSSSRGGLPPLPPKGPGVHHGHHHPGGGWGGPGVGVDRMAGPSGPHQLATPLPEGDTLMDASQMSNHRPDGYRRLVAPLLFGEGNLPASLLGTVEERLRAGMVSLLSLLPFWEAGEEGQDKMKQLGGMLGKIQVGVAY